MKCFPLDLRHLQRDSGFSAGFGEDGEPAYTLTSAATGGGNIPAVAIVMEEGDEGMGNPHDTAGWNARLDGRKGVLPEGFRPVGASACGGGSWERG